MLINLLKLLKFVWTHPINRNSRFKAIFRVIRFQISSRIFNVPFLIPFVNDTFLFTKKGMTGATGNLYCGLSEYSDMGFVLHTLQPGDLFVDIGSNIGSYSILAASCRDVDVISVEPIPTTFSWLQKNIKINNFEKKIFAMNIGLAEIKGSIKFSSNFDTINHVLSNDEKDSSAVDVNVSTLDEILKEKFPTIIKIDVEGYESKVLDGAKNIINNPSLIAIIIELNGSGKRYGIEDNSIHKFLISKGFNSFKYNPHTYQLESLNNQINEISNTLYIRKLDIVKKRISRKLTFSLGIEK